MQPLYRPRRRYKPYPAKHTVMRNGRVRLHPTQQEDPAWAGQQIYVRALMPCFIAGNPTEEGQRAYVYLPEYVRNRGRGLFARVAKRLRVCGREVLIFTEVVGFPRDVAAKIEPAPTYLYQGTGHAEVPAPRELHGPAAAREVREAQVSDRRKAENVYVQCLKTIEQSEVGTPEWQEAVDKLEALRLTIKRLGGCGCARKREMRDALARVATESALAGTIKE